MQIMLSLLATIWRLPEKHENSRLLLTDFKYVLQLRVVFAFLVHCFVEVVIIAVCLFADVVG